MVEIAGQVMGEFEDRRQAHKNAYDEDCRWRESERKAEAEALAGLKQHHWGQGPSGVALVCDDCHIARPPDLMPAECRPCLATLDDVIAYLERECTSLDRLRKRVARTRGALARIEIEHGRAVSGGLVR